MWVMKLPQARRARIAHGVRLGRRVTVSEVARSIGITRCHLGDIELLRKGASVEVAELLADLYGCTAEDLASGSRGKPADKPSQPKQPTGPRRREESDTKGPTRVVTA